MNLYFRLLDRLQAFLNIESVRSRYNGYTIFHHRDDSLIVEVKKHADRMYERLETDVICEILQRHNEPRLLDIGANIGLMSLNILRCIPAAHIYAVEPGPYQCEHLRKNVHHNNLQQRVDINNIAFGLRNGKVSFSSHAVSDSSGDGFVDTGRAGESREIEVECRTLDAWWTDKGQPPVHVVKLDTEGAELQVLQAGIEFLRVNKPAILVEICHLNYRKYNLTFGDYFNFFRSIEYVLFEIGGTTPLTADYTDEKTYKFSFLAQPETQV